MLAPVGLWFFGIVVSLEMISVTTFWFVPRDACKGGGTSA